MFEAGVVNKLSFCNNIWCPENPNNSVITAKPDRCRRVVCGLLPQLRQARRSRMRYTNTDLMNATATNLHTWIQWVTSLVRLSSTTTIQEHRPDYIHVWVIRLENRWTSQYTYTCTVSTGWYRKVNIFLFRPKIQFRSEVLPSRVGYENISTCTCIL